MTYNKPNLEGLGQIVAEVKKPSRLEQLQAHSLKLEKELETLRKSFADDFSEATFNYISEESAEEFVNKWLEKVRQETSLLKNADDLGVRIFGENLDQQDMAMFQRYSRNITISFDPNLTHHERPNCAGFAEPGGKIKLKGSQPTQREQLWYFVSQGKLHPVVANLVHELIHTFHHDENLEMDKKTTESQAYANGIIEALPLDSVEITAEHILKDYDFPKDEIISIINDILFLYSRGESTRMVAAKLRAIKPVFKGAWAIEKFYIKPIMESEKISEDEKDEMIKGYLLQNQIERVKAQNVFFEVFRDWMKPTKS